MITQILLKDSLNQNKKSVSDKTIQSLTDFFLFPNTRYMSISGDTIFVSDKIITIYDTTTKTDRSVIANHQCENLYHENSPSLFSSFERTIDDPIKFSIDTQIPLKRLTGDYKDLSDFNSQYHRLLNDLYRKIDPVIVFISDHSDLIIDIEQQPSFSDKIRKFLSDELN